MACETAAHSGVLMTQPIARLRAIISLAPSERVRCQQPGCHHSVYAAVHVVQESGVFLVLGSRCYEKRYGHADALGQAQYGGGAGRKLTDAERQALLANTAALIARFEEEDRARAAALALEAEEHRARQVAIEQERQNRAERLNRLHAQEATPAPSRALSVRPNESPWPWQSTRFTSIARLTAPTGRTWVRVQHMDGSHRIVPWPVFPGWETALPPEVGPLDHEVRGYRALDIARALSLLRERGFSPPVVGTWQSLLGRPR